MTTKYDVIVIGAGPAGATATSILAKNNINTLLIEKEELPRPKICGGAVSKRALLILEHANIKVPKLNTFKKCDSMQLGTFDFDCVENLANVRFDNEAAYLTDRGEFDHAIVKDAVSKGAELRQNLMVKNIEKESSQFTIKGNDFSFNSIFEENYPHRKNPLFGIRLKLMQMWAYYRKTSWCSPSLHPLTNEVRRWPSTMVSPT